MVRIYRFSHVSSGFTPIELRLNRRNSGFTLIELLVAIAVIAILSAAVLVAINPGQKIKQANDARIKADVGQIAHAVQAYYTSKIYYPFASSELTTTYELRSLPIPPGGGNYNFAIPASCNSGATSNCTSVVVWYPLTAQTANYCWDTANGVKSPSNNTAIGVNATVCP